MTGPGGPDPGSGDAVPYVYVALPASDVSFTVTVTATRPAACAGATKTICVPARADDAGRRELDVTYDPAYGYPRRMRERR